MYVDRIDQLAVKSLFKDYYILALNEHRARRVIDGSTPGERIIGQLIVVNLILSKISQDQM